MKARDEHDRTGEGGSQIVGSIVASHPAPVSFLSPRSLRRISPQEAKRTIGRQDESFEAQKARVGRAPALYGYPKIEPYLLCPGALPLWPWLSPL